MKSNNSKPKADEVEDARGAVIEIRDGPSDRRSKGKGAEMRHVMREDGEGGKGRGKRKERK